MVMNKIVVGDMDQVMDAYKPIIIIMDRTINKVIGIIMEINNM